MKNISSKLIFSILSLLVPYLSSAQQHVAVISRCGGVDTVVIPNITDNDHDGMDDHLEQMLLDKFMPPVMMFSNENCPGPALNGTGDTNLIATRISPYPQQYTWSSTPDSVQVHPVPLVAARHLVPGMIWHNHFIMVHTAVLYGQDCGLLGHQADVEGFHFSLVYTGPDSAAGWMYDTIMNRWVGATIQSVGHDGTACQQIQTLPYRSYLNPSGADTIYASPNKHANYLTVPGCNSPFICNPNCNSAQTRKITINVNLGEPGAPLVNDLGTYYAAYGGQNPWGTTNFLNGGAGTIAAKMERALTTDFVHGTAITAAQICPLYFYCYGLDQHVYSDVSCSNIKYTFHGRTLTHSGFYTDTLSNFSSCDSVVKLTLTIYRSDTTSLTDYVCSGNVYDFNGMRIVASGLYRDTITSIHGCDSTLLLNLAMHYPTAYTYSAHACTGNTYNLNGRTLAAPGQYTDTVTNVSGCDSIISLTLAIDTPVTVTWTSSTDTVLPHTNDLLLTATPSGGIYTGTGVAGNIFYPDSAAHGANVITYTYTDQYGCSSQAIRTYYLYVAGVNEIELASRISLYPNPANDIIIAQSDLFANNNDKPTITDITGHIITVEADMSGNEIKLHIGSLSAGMYLIRFTANGTQLTKKFIKPE
jgi:hypothetical protein